MDKALAYVFGVVIGLVAGATAVFITASTPGLVHGYAIVRECDGAVAALVAVDRTGASELYHGSNPAPQDVYEWYVEAPEEAVTAIVVPCPAPKGLAIRYSEVL